MIETFGRLAAPEPSTLGAGFQPGRGTLTYKQCLAAGGSYTYHTKTCHLPHPRPAAHLGCEGTESCSLGAADPNVGTSLAGAVIGSVVLLAGAAAATGALVGAGGAKAVAKGNEKPHYAKDAALGAVAGVGTLIVAGLLKG